MNSSKRYIKLFSIGYYSPSYISPLWGKGNLTINFGQATECNMKNVFLEKSSTKCEGDTIPRPFPTS